MRTAKVLLLGLLLTVGGCAGGGGDDGDGVASAQGATAAPSPSVSASRDPDAPLKFAQCMRAQGMTWFPDPQPDGRMRIRTPKGMDPEKFEAAQQACQQYAPPMDANRRADPEMLEKARQMAKCMRENGVPDFPDPQPDGGIRVDRGKTGSGPGDPAFDRAEEKCGPRA